MNNDQAKQQAIMNAIELLRADLRRAQDRAGVMVALIATILGIGLPLIAQPQTKQYFHLMPFTCLIIAFICFYLAFTRGTNSLVPRTMHVSSGGQTKDIELLKKYKPNIFEAVISYNFSRKLKMPTDICARLEKQLLLRQATTKWGHSFFLTAIVLEAYEVIVTISGRFALFNHLLIGGLSLVFVRLVFLFSSTGEQRI